MNVWQPAINKTEWRRPCCRNSDVVIMADSYGRSIANDKQILANLGLPSSRGIEVHSFSGMNLEHAADLLRYGRLKNSLRPVEESDRRAAKHQKLVEKQNAEKQAGRWSNQNRKMQKSEVRHQYMVDKKDAKINKKREETKNWPTKRKSFHKVSYVYSKPASQKKKTKISPSSATFPAKSSSSYAGLRQH